MRLSAARPDCWVSKLRRPASASSGPTAWGRSGSGRRARRAAGPRRGGRRPRQRRARRLAAERGIGGELRRRNRRAARRGGADRIADPTVGSRRMAWGEARRRDPQPRRLSLGGAVGEPRAQRRAIEPKGVVLRRPAASPLSERAPAIAAVTVGRRAGQRDGVVALARRRIRGRASGGGASAGGSLVTSMSLTSTGSGDGRRQQRRPLRASGGPLPSATGSPERP